MCSFPFPNYRLYSWFSQDVNQYVPHYQNSPIPETMFTETCRSAGFEVIECSAPEQSFAFPNLNTLKSIFYYFSVTYSIIDANFICDFLVDVVAAVNPFLHRIPAKLRERYLIECLAELQKLKSPSNDGSTVASYRLMIAHLRRPQLDL